MRYDDLEHKCNELFDDFAVLSADIMVEDSEHWREWIAAGRHGAMGYMERERADLDIILSGVQTVIVVSIGYSKNRVIDGVARCFGGERDYHKTVKSKLKELLRHIEALEHGVRGRAVVDSAPALEKAWAIRGGLGWRGRNSLLITPNGSYFNLGLLLLDVKVEGVPAVEILESKCGNCTKCIAACPTGALCDNYTVDARRCISYLNMEAPRLGVQIAEEELFGWTKGCDACQECCPWNRSS